MSASNAITGTVTSVITDGKHGAYAVVSHEEYGSITFSLWAKVWAENEPPETGETVHLSELRHLQSGWRAKQARRLQPSDLQP